MIGTPFLPGISGSCSTIRECRRRNLFRISGGVNKFIRVICDDKNGRNMPLDVVKHFFKRSHVCVNFDDADGFSCPQIDDGSCDRNDF